MLTRRALNRATLDRQLLLRRREIAPLDALTQLIGMQAQNPHDPYFGLWARLDGFDPHQLGELIINRQAVRMQLMRGTIHLVTARDARGLRSLVGPVLARTFGTTAFAKDVRGIDRDELLNCGRALLEERPRTRAELGSLLGQRWAGREASSLAQAVTYLEPVVQVPPRGVWNQKGAAAWATLSTWLGQGPEPMESIENLVLRYLAAFGPAAVGDIRTWSGLSGLTEVVERLRPRLASFRNERGTELFDLPDAPRPDPDTSAPPRLLPEYDNLLLAHADRSRFFESGLVPSGWRGRLLLDGFFGGSWKRIRTRQSVSLEVQVLPKVAKRTLAAVSAEGERLLESTDPEAHEKRVRVVPLA